MTASYPTESVLEDVTRSCREGSVSLDPADWNAFSRSAHRALDAALEHLRGAGDRPWRGVPSDAVDDIERPLPRAAGDLDEVLDRTERSVLPYPTGNGHRRFWGWVMGSGLPDAVIADLLASAMNPNVAGYDQSSALVERRVLRWMAELMNFPLDCGGTLANGATMANLVGLATARRVKAGFDVRAEGLADGPRLTVYGSKETHSWADKSCDVLGLGRNAFRRVDADEEGRVIPDALRAAIRQDRQQGARPICVVANVGTVDTGAIDDLQALAELCRDEDLWLHVDGAFGAMLACSPKLRHRVRGLELADSLAFDWHKWGYLPYEIACVLVRDRDAHLETFRTGAAYLASPGRGVQPEPLEFPNFGIPLSRGFRALKVWMALQVHGTDRIGQAIEQNVAQVEKLVKRIQAEGHLELMAPAPLNVACFRYVTPDASEEVLEAINHEILLRLQEDGIAVPSSTRRSGRFVLRVAITNHRTRFEDIDVFVDAVLRLGADLSATL